MSFLRGLFSGRRIGAVPRFPSAGEEERENLALVLDALGRFARDNIDAAEIDREHRIAPGLLQGLRDLGLFGLVVPELHGGGGFGATSYCRVLEELTRFSPSVAVTLGAHQSIGLKALLLFGSEAQQQSWLPSLATGERIAGFALTEANAGSDAGGIRTTARRRGSGWVLEGSKQWITNGGIGQFFTVFAKASPGAGGGEGDVVTAFLVESDRAGFSRGKEESKLGITGSSTTALFFREVELPAEALLGEVGQGFRIAMEVLNEGRLGLAAGAVGAMKQSLALAAQYARERRQFGRPIAEFDMIRAKIARITLDIFAAESMVYATTALVDAGERDFSLESAAVKVFASEASVRAADLALQVAGGYGYMKDYPFERILRDARINTIFEGTNEILRLYLAASGLRGPGEELKVVARALGHPLASIGVLSDFAVRSLKRRVLGVELAGIDPTFATEAAAWNELASRLAEVGARALRSYRKEILEQELVIERLADAAIELYAMAASLGRATGLIQERGEDAARDAILLARTFAVDARRRVRRSLRAAESAEADDALRAVAARALDHGGYPLV